MRNADNGKRRRRKSETEKEGERKSALRAAKDFIAAH